MKTNELKVPMSFWIIAVIFLLWNLMGVASFFAHTFITEEAKALLPQAERELYGEYPMWVTIIFAIAVFAGFLGAIGLVLRKKWSKLFFIISLSAIIPQMIHNIFFTSSIEVYGVVQASVMPIMVAIFGVFLVWYTDLGIKKQWLK